MDIIIEDTNIFIDLYQTGLGRFVQQLEIDFRTSIYVLLEVVDEPQYQYVLGLLEKGVLKAEDFEGDEQKYLFETTQTYGGKSNLSLADCSVMLLAERYQCRLLTSDRKLRLHAQERGLEVSGFLWLTDELVRTEVLTEEEMIVYLKRYKDTNPRAPMREIDLRIEKYRTK